MKKLFLAVAAVAMVFATSCKKENVNEPEVPAGDNEFICVIDQNANPQNAPMVDDGMGTMAHIDGNNNVWWQAGDEITYYGQQVDATGQNVGDLDYYTLTCSKMESDGRAYFSNGSMHFGQGTHVAYYPATLYKGTDGLLLPDVINLEAGKNAGFLPMYGTGTGTHYLTFHNICAVLKITIPDVTGCTQIILSADNAMCGKFMVDRDKSNTDGSGQHTGAYSARPLGSGTTLTVKKQNDDEFTNGEIVYVPIIPRHSKSHEGVVNKYSNFTIVLRDINDELLSTPADPQEIQVETGKVYPVTLSPKTGGNHSITEDGFQTSKFNVGENNDPVWVQFAKGNLYYTGSGLATEDDALKGGASDALSHTCQFYFYDNIQNAAQTNCPISSGYNLPNDLFCVYTDNNTPFALSQNQWENLLNRYTSANAIVKRNAGDEAGQKCILIAPHGFQGNIASEYTLDQVISNGFLCLPITGRRNRHGQTGNPYSEDSNYISYMCADHHAAGDGCEPMLKMVEWNMNNYPGADVEITENCEGEMTRSYANTGSIRLVRITTAP